MSHPAHFSAYTLQSVLCLHFLSSALHICKVHVCDELSVHNDQPYNAKDLLHLYQKVFDNAMVLVLSTSTFQFQSLEETKTNRLTKPSNLIIA